MIAALTLTGCLVVGDSLGQGVAGFLPECRSDTVVGITAETFDRVHPAPDSDIVVISLGTNPGQDDEAHLRAVRAKTQARIVVWLLPPTRDRDIVLKIAGRRGDRIVDIKPYVTPGGDVHPPYPRYRAIAAEVQAQTM